MIAVLARRVVMAGGVWMAGIAGSYAAFSVLQAGGFKGWPVDVVAFVLGSVVWTASRRVWRWSKVEP